MRSSRAERHAEASLRRRRWPVPLLAGLLLGQMALSMLLSSRDDAPTYDEPAHLAAGVGYLLLYFGTARPGAYGLDAVDLRRLPRWDLDDLDGVVLASASTLALYDDPRFDQLCGRAPIAQVGHSILVYWVP